jgi:hypothetical protein
VDTVRRLAASHGVPFAAVGSVGSPRGVFRITVGTTTWEWPSTELRRIHLDAIPRRMAAPAAAGAEVS